MPDDRTTCGDNGGRTRDDEPCRIPVAEGRCHLHDEEEPEPEKSDETVVEGDFSEGRLTCGDNGGRTADGSPCSKPVEEGRCHWHQEEMASGAEKAQGETVIEGDFGNQEDADYELPLDVPEYLNARGREVWKTIVRRLMDRGLVDEMDEYSLYGLAQSYVFMEYSGARIMKEGLIDEDNAHGGRPRKHPAFQTWRDAFKQFRSVAEDFGMTPAAREALEIEDTSDAEEKFLKDVLGIEP